MPTPTLYELADRLHAASPWETLEEADLIRLIHPVTGESAHISIMGSYGEHRCLALYLGEEALRRLNLAQEDDPDDPEIPALDTLGLILEARQLQISFGSRDQLRKDELAEIKKLGRKYRGDNWPMFRSYKPGRAPGPVDEVEILWLTIALEQFLILFPALPTTSTGCISTFRPNEGELDILTRRLVDGVWSSAWTEHNASSHEWVTPAPSDILLEKVRRQERLADIDCHFQILPAPVGAAKSAVFPYLAISVEPKSGLVLGMNLLSVEDQPFEQLIASIPDVYLAQWAGAGIRPASIRVQTITTYSMLEIAAADLNTPMRRADKLPSIERVMRSLPL